MRGRGRDEGGGEEGETSGVERYTRAGEESEEGRRGELERERARAMAINEWPSMTFAQALAQTLE